MFGYSYIFIPDSCCHYVFDSVYILCLCTGKLMDIMFSIEMVTCLWYDVVTLWDILVLTQ